MWPWGHAAVGYLLYVALARARYHRRPGSVAVVLLAIGTQFPDLVDKPLSWSLGVLPTGRTLAHTLLVAVPVCVAVVLYARRRGVEAWGVAFSLGYISHVIVDALPPLLWGDRVDAHFLLWPILSVPRYDETPSLLSAATSVDVSLYFAVQLALTVAAIGLWWRDGRPGLSWCVAPVRRALG